MQSETTMSLYEKLISVTSDMEAALCNSDLKTALQLAEVYNAVIKEIKDQGISHDLKIQQTVENANKQNMSIINKIQSMQKDIALQLSTMNNRRKLKTAYDL